MTNNWLIDYHHALQLRLLGLLIIFGVIFPGLCLLLAAGRGMAQRVVRRAADPRRAGVLHAQL
jgi:hypothetical protein